MKNKFYEYYKDGWKKTDRLLLFVMYRNKKLGIDDFLPFGKFKDGGSHGDQNIANLVSNESWYMDWLISNKVISCSEEIMINVGFYAQQNASHYSANHGISHSDDDPIYGGCDPNMWGGIGI